MNWRVALILIVVALVAGVGIEYIISTTTSTETNSCTPLSSLAHVPIPVGFTPTVSYEGEWSASIATFAAKPTNASALTYVCTYEAQGTITFYVGLANYLGGWNTLVVLAHKLDSNGNLTVTASIGNETSTNSTAQPYGSVVMTLSFYFNNG